MDQRGVGVFHNKLPKKQFPVGGEERSDGQIVVGPTFKAQPQFFKERCRQQPRTRRALTHAFLCCLRSPSVWHWLVGTLKLGNCSLCFLWHRICLRAAGNNSPVRK